MTYMSSFSDEFKKIAGEMQGFTRIGRKPISIEKMLSNESEITGLPEDFAPAIEKAASAMVKMSGRGRAAALIGAGAVGALAARQAKEDHKLGRMVRKQQEQQQ